MAATPSVNVTVSGTTLTIFANAGSGAEAGGALTIRGGTAGTPNVAGGAMSVAGGAGDALASARSDGSEGGAHVKLSSVLLRAALSAQLAAHTSASS